MTFISNTCSTRFKPFIDSWCSVHTEPTYNGEFPQASLLLPKETALRHIVLRWCNLAKECPCFRPRCCHSTEGRVIYCTWLNSSTGIVNTAQCASSSLFQLLHNLKIAFTFWFTLVQPEDGHCQAPKHLVVPYVLYFYIPLPTNKVVLDKYIHSILVKQEACVCFFCMLSWRIYFREITASVLSSYWMNRIEQNLLTFRRSFLVQGCGTSHNNNIR